MLTPSLEAYLEQVGSRERLPVCARIPADLETPVSAFLKLKPNGAMFLLESVERGIQLGRYSFIGVSPYATVSLVGDTVEIERSGELRRVAVDPADPFSPIREEFADESILIGDHLPGPFASAVGYVSYDIARFFERVPTPEHDELGLPDYSFVFPGTLLVFDHVKSEIEILVLPPEGEPRAAYEAARSQIELLLDALRGPLPPAEEAATDGKDTSFDSNMTEDAFKEKVAAAREYILAGDALQIVLSQRLRGKSETSPFQVYRALRILNPSPYMFFIDFGRFQLVGSSPEVLVKLEGRKATVSPIAGTRPRGGTTAEDHELERELLANEKERAEHVMLVDLGRNDLGRVCELGSVVTESLMEVEKYSHVMHIVSSVTGTLPSDVDMFGLLGATFPAGTVSGAPKIRAMEIISELEGDKRGPYAGAVGYFGRQGDMDMCITIRTLIVRGNEYFAQTGAGIVADSDPDFEYEETLSKIRALLKAISIAEKGL
jgi:anthranilate synthase component 1